jgi:hypothetical protein
MVTAQRDRGVAPWPGTAAVPFGVAVVAWIGCWLAANLVGGAVIAASGADADELPTWGVLVGALCLWVPLLVLCWKLGRRFGVGSISADYAFQVRLVDVVAVAVGAALQVAVVPGLYAPLRATWPETFSDEALEENVRRLVERATGGWLVVLWLIVVLGAPVVEEIVYRGLLQGAALRRFSPAVAIAVSAALFALIHFRPVEYPGLFVVGVVLGVCAWWTGRLGPAVIAHMAFNATALALSR